MLQVPVLDLKDFRNPLTKNEFCNQLGKAYQEIGFVSIKNHDIDDTFLDELYNSVKAFYALDEATKKKYIGKHGGQRGYTPFGVEHAKDSKHADLKEFWHFGQPVDPKNIYEANIKVEELPDFYDNGIKAFLALQNLGLEMLRAIALYLNLEEEFFTDKVQHGNSILRPIHYPPLKSLDTNAVRAGAHEDINLITLLIGASADGLEVLSKDNVWVPITKIEGAIVVNVGDMLQRWSNNILRSTTHRVVNPPADQMGSSRYSIPFFMHPEPDVSLAVLDSCITNGQKHYEDITAGDYLLERLREIGLIK